MISIGTIGLIKAIITFDEEKGTRLATYAARCIENEILMTIRASKKTKTEVSLHDPIGIDKEGNEISLIDILGSDSDVILDEVELKIQIKKLYQRMDTALKKRERLVLELRYGLLNGISKTQREIADMLGISRSYIQNRKQSNQKAAQKNFTMKTVKNRIEIQGNGGVCAHLSIYAIEEDMKNRLKRIFI